jgi:hypothetical protein
MKHPPASVLLTAVNVALVFAVFIAAHTWFAARATSSPAPPPVRDSPTAAEVSGGGRLSTYTYYFVSTPTQALLVEKLDPHGAALVVTSLDDEAQADSIIFDDSQQSSVMGGPAVVVSDLRLDAAPVTQSGQTIESQVHGKLPGAPFQPAYVDGVTYCMVDSPEEAALLDATFQRLGKQVAAETAPVSRYVIAIERTPQDAERYLTALEGEAAFAGSESPYRIVNLRAAADSEVGADDVGR